MKQHSDWAYVEQANQRIADLEAEVSVLKFDNESLGRRLGQEIVDLRSRAEKAEAENARLRSDIVESQEKTP